MSTEITSLNPPRNELERRIVNLRAEFNRLQEDRYLVIPIQVDDYKGNITCVFSWIDDDYCTVYYQLEDDNNEYGKAITELFYDMKPSRVGDAEDAFDLEISKCCDEWDSVKEVLGICPIYGFNPSVDNEPLKLIDEAVAILEYLFGPAVNEEA